MARIKFDVLGTDLREMINNDFFFFTMGKE